MGRSLAVFAVYLMGMNNWSQRDGCWIHQHSFALMDRH
jgi:hypothetical protein